MYKNVKPLKKIGNLVPGKPKQFTLGRIKEIVTGLPPTFKCMYLKDRMTLAIINTFSLKAQHGELESFTTLTALCICLVEASTGLIYVALSFLYLLTSSDKNEVWAF